MSNAAEVLDIQADLKDRITSNLQFRNMIRGQLEDMATQGSSHKETIEGLKKFAESALYGMATSLVKADAYHVTADMVDLVEWSSAQLDESDVFNGRLAPSPVGIVRFDQPLFMHDGRGLTIKIDLLLWHPVVMKGVDGTRNATVIHYFNSLDNPDDYAQSLLRDYGRDMLVQNFGLWFLGGSVVVVDDVSVGPSMLNPGEDYREKLVETGIIAQHFTNMKRKVHALWLLCNQSTTLVSKESVPRSFARRAQRAKINPEVTIIELRRRSVSTDHPELSHREWSRRWMVNGGWQWRQCGKDHPFAQPYDKGWHCRAYIGVYEKGPEDKPLVLTNKVYNLKR